MGESDCEKEKKHYRDNSACGLDADFSLLRRPAAFSIRALFDFYPLLSSMAEAARSALTMLGPSHFTQHYLVM